MASTTKNSSAEGTRASGHSRAHLDMQQLLSKGLDLHTARALQGQVLTRRLYAPAEQERLCTEWKDVDVLVVLSQDLDGQDPARLLPLWALLLGRGYSEVVEEHLRGRAQVLVKERWMSRAIFRMDLNTQAPSIMTVGGEVQHALRSLAHYASHAGDGQVAGNTEQQLLEYFTARLPKTQHVETLRCSPRVCTQLRAEFKVTCIPTHQHKAQHGRQREGSTIVSMPAQADMENCYDTLAKISDWCLLLPLHVALKLGALSQPAWQYHFLRAGSEQFVWIMNGVHEHEHFVYRDLAAATLNAIVGVHPHTYAEVAATRQKTALSRFESLLTLLQHINQPRVPPDTAELTQDGEVVDGTCDARILLPDWTDEHIRVEPATTRQGTGQLNTTRAQPQQSQTPMGAHVPMVVARVGASMVNALVDTGASCCVVRRDFLARVFGEAWITQHITHVANAPYFVLGDGSTGATSGMVAIQVSFGQRQFTAHCWVFPKASYDLILGAEFLEANNVDVCMRQRKLKFNNAKLDVSFVGSRPSLSIAATPCVVSAACDFWLSPYQEELTDGVVGSIPGVDPERATYGLLAPDYNMAVPSSVLANGPTIVGADRKTKILVANFTECAVLVRAGTRLGSFTPQDSNDFTTIAISKDDPAFRKELQEALDAARQAEEHANVQLPPMYFDQLGDAPNVETSTTELPPGLDLDGVSASPEQLQQLKQVLGKYSKYMRDGDGAPALVKGIEFKIDLVEGAQPQRMRTRRYPLGPLREAAEKQTADMLRNGVVRPSSTSSWSASVVLVPKKNGKLRYCVDYTALNKITKPLAYDLPRIDDFLDSLGGSQYFSSLDMMSGYWAIPMREEDKEKTAFQSPLGALEWNRTPFGLCNVPAFYARMMDVILGPKLPCSGRCAKASDEPGQDPPCTCARKSLKYACAQCYLDDILVYSPSFQQHLKDLDSVLGRLCGEYNLTLRTSKCFFARKELEVLGHVVSAAGVKPSPSKVQAIEALQYPKDRKALKGFLGAAGYYRRFIKSFAAIASPLNKLLKQDVAWPRDPPPDAFLAFETLKAALAQDCVQAHPDWSADICVETDASVHGLGATLTMRRPGSKGTGKVLQFASRALQPHEKQYGQSELEGLCVIWALSLFRAYLLGRKFTVITDCSALKSIYGAQASKKSAGRMNRWALRLSEFTFDVEHRPGTANVNVDLFSRQPATSNSGPAIEPLYASLVMNTMRLKNTSLMMCYMETVCRHQALNVATRAAKRKAASEDNASKRQRLEEKAHEREAEGPPAQHNDNRRRREPQPQTSSDKTRQRGQDEHKHQSGRDTKHEAKQESGHADKQQDEVERLNKLAATRVLEDVTTDLATKLRKHYRSDKLAQHVLTKSKVSPALGEVRFFRDQRDLIRYTGSATRESNEEAHMPLYVPTALRDSVLHAFHGLPLLGHMGFSRTWPLLRSRFHWPGVTRDLRRWLAACLCCRRRKDSRNVRHGLSSPMARTPAPFHTVHFDLVGPFEETATGNTYVLTLICPFTQFPFAVAIPNKEAETVARALGKIFSLVGHPKIMVSDRAKEFVGEVIQGLSNLFDIKHIKTSGYQPQGNCVERFHRYLVAALTIHCHEVRTSWEDALDPILFAFRASVSTTTGHSPFFLVYGRQAPLPLDSVFGLEHDAKQVSLPAYTQQLKCTLQNVYKSVAKTQLAAAERNRLNRDSKEKREQVVYQPGDIVLVWGPVTAGAPYVKTKLLYQWSVPKIVKTRVSDLHYKLLERVELKRSVEYRTSQPVHVNRLRPYTPMPDGSPSVQNVPPPPRTAWEPVAREPRVGELVVICTTADWDDKPFDVGRILHVVSERGRKRFIVHWHGNRQDQVEGVQAPCYVDTRDNKRVYKQRSGARWKPWTSATTNTIVTMENILLVGVELTRAGKLCADDLARLETCPHLHWSPARAEPSSLFE